MKQTFVTVVFKYITIYYYNIFVIVVNILQPAVNLRGQTKVNVA